MPYSPLISEEIPKYNGYIIFQLFLVWLICNEVSVQQVLGDVELMIAVRRSLVFARPHH